MRNFCDALVLRRISKLHEGDYVVYKTDCGVLKFAKFFSYNDQDTVKIKHDIFEVKIMVVNATDILPIQNGFFSDSFPLYHYVDNSMLGIIKKYTNLNTDYFDQIAQKIITSWGIKKNQYYYFILIIYF